jgi:hypothetical protein
MKLQKSALVALLLTGVAHAADTTTVFNEVMYHPSGAADPEWVELYNKMAVNMDLSGWEISGGVNFTFPNGTVIAAGGYLVVASNPGAMPGVSALGPWTGSLNNGGETIRLRDRTRRVMDELNYNDSGAWPLGADGGGCTLARRAGHLSGTLPEHWVASVSRGGTPGAGNFDSTLGAPQSLFGLGDAWLYQGSSAGLEGGWAATSYAAGTGGWLSGNGVLAFEDTALPATVGTVLPTPASHPTGTYYLQKQFTFFGTPSQAQLSLRTLTDDGSLIYLNGTEVARRRMATGSVTAATRASDEVGNAAFEDLTLPTTALVNGTNTLSVEVHQAGTPLVSEPGTGGLTLSGLTLDQVGGVIFSTNYSRQSGAVAFAKDLVGNGAYAPTHKIANLNNGTYSNPSSWIGNSLNSFCGVSFGAITVSLGRVAWGRDNTATSEDRTVGLYTLQYTSVPSPTASTPQTENPATGWATIGTASYPSDGVPYSQRHAFSFTPVMATGIRLTVPGDGVGSGGCVDELEAAPAAAPGSPIFLLMATGGLLDVSGDMARTGTAFAKDLIANGAYAPTHTIPNLNDGVFGNGNSWIGNTANSFCGISFATARPMGRIAFGRDNTATFTDRTLGGYTLQYTTVASPGASTPDASWTTIGVINVGGSFALPSQRHVYEFAAVTATGLRIITPDGACIDELEIYGPVNPDVVWGASLETRQIISEPVPPSLRISEIAGSSAGTWRVEIQNTGASSVNVGGLVLTASGIAGGYTLPSQTLAPGGLLVLDQTKLGLRPLLEDRVFLMAAGSAVLIDAAAVKTTTRARDSLGRMLVPIADSFGGANAFALNSDIVINEVMYHFPPNSAPVIDNPEEWIEIHNKSAAPVSVAGWKLDDAVSFTLPVDTTIPAGGFLVVAKDAATLAAKWPEHSTRIIGNFSGTLSSTTDRIVLNDAVGNPVDETRYYTGGAWPETPDGGGASLELRDPRAENSVGGAWAASDESSDTTWQIVSYTMIAGQTFGQTLWNEFRLGLLDGGECLVDDVSVVRVSNSQQLIQGGNFESLSTKWRVLGNHGASAIEAEPGVPSNHVLHIRSTGAFSWSHNHIETSFTGNTALVDGQSYTVSFRARWLSGTNQLNTRAYYSRLARTTELTMVTRIGTPGAVNSRAVANLGPTLSGLTQSPMIPNAGEPGTVSATATDPDGVASLTLRYALNGSATFASVPMTASGATYSAQIPGQAAATIVQFYIEAADSAAATSTLPSAGAASRALYLVNDGAGTALAAHELRVIMLPADSTTLLAPLNRLSDGRIGGTAVYRRSEVFYDVGVRLQGTAAGRIRDGEDYPGYDVGFPADHLFRGLHNNLNIDRSGRGPVIRQQHEIYVKHAFHRAGVPCTYDDLVYFIAPNSIHTGTAIMQMAGYGSEFVDSEYGGDGTVFNLDGTYEPSTTTDGNFESFKNPVPLAEHLESDFADLGTDKEQYRGQLDPRAGSRADDYSGLIAFSKAMGDTGPNFATNIAARMDVDEWMRCAALYSLFGVADCYMTNGFQHNFRVHVPSDGMNVAALAWDMDFVHNFATNSAAILVGGNLLRVVNTVPGARHAYYGHLHDLCQTVYNSTYMTPWLSHYGSVVGQNYTGNVNYIEARRTSILSQLPPTVPFSITTNGGANFTVNAASTTLAGNGWINVREIRRSDTNAALDLTWSTDTAWTGVVGLNFGANLITLVGYDGSGAQGGTASITITSTLAAPDPHDHLRITEIHYNPTAPAGGEVAASTDNDDFEFIELRNFHPTQNLDISQCKFTAGVDFTFPSTTTLAPGEYIHVAHHLAAFNARYGVDPRRIGPYGPSDSLSNGGESITLVDATGAEIQSITYKDSWYPQTDGGGYSLIVIAPTLVLDRTIASSFRASTTIGGNPSSSDAVTFFGTPTADLDGDGLNAFLEHALATSDGVANTSGIAVIREPDGTLTLTFTSRLNADDVALSLETATSPNAFTASTPTVLSAVQSGTMLTQTWRVVPPNGAGQFFVRLKATSR